MVGGGIAPSPVRCALFTPRISFGHSKTVICACSMVPGTGRVVPALAEVDGRWGAGRLGIPGEYYPPSRYTLGLVLPGPNHCQIAGITVTQGTPGPSRTLRTPCSRTRSLVPLQPNIARFHHIS